MAAGTSAEYRHPPNVGSRAQAAADKGGSASRGRWRPWRLLRVAAGFLLLVLGVIGLFLPILQGVLMILAGLAVLGKDVPWSRTLTERLAAFVRRRAGRGGKTGPPAPRPETR